MQKYEIQNTRFTSATCLIHHRAQSPPTDCCSAFFNPLWVSCRCNWCCAPFRAMSTHRHTHARNMHAHSHTHTDTHARNMHAHTHTHRLTQKDRRTQYAGYGILSRHLLSKSALLNHTDHENQPVRSGRAPHHDNLNSRNKTRKPTCKCGSLYLARVEERFFWIILIVYFVLDDIDFCNF